MQAPRNGRRERSERGGDRVVTAEEIAAATARIVTAEADAVRACRTGRGSRGGRSLPESKFYSPRQEAKSARKPGAAPLAPKSPPASCVWYSMEQDVLVLPGDPRQVQGWP